MATLVPKVMATGSKKLRIVMFLDTIFQSSLSRKLLKDKTTVVNKCDTWI